MGLQNSVPDLQPLQEVHKDTMFHGVDYPEE